MLSWLLYKKQINNNNTTTTANNNNNIKKTVFQNFWHSRQIPYFLKIKIKATLLNIFYVSMD